MLHDAIQSIVIMLHDAIQCACMHWVIQITQNAPIAIMLHNAPSVYVYVCHY